MRFIRLYSFAVLMIGMPIAAQTRGQLVPSETGSVSGHILCSDTQRPARLAEVRLVPISIAPVPSTAKANLLEDEAALGSQLPPVQTDMGGAYSLRNIRPGTYYLRIDYTGYLTPLLAFTREQLAQPTSEVRQQIAAQLQVVNVAPHANTVADATILRGSALSGTVRYDDGSPAVGIGVHLYRRNAKGEFRNEYQAFRFSSPTDDHGRYHIDSLPADEFVVGANFSISESQTSTMPMPNGGSGTMQFTIQKVLFSLPLYSGDSLRLKTASIIKTDAGQESAGVDLTLPLSKLHPVSGSVVAKDGHLINSGTVALLYADTHEKLTDVPISREDGQFRFLYVPEANYILSVEEANDVTQIEVPNPPGSNPRTHHEDKVLRAYGTVEQPLTVQNDLASLVATVPDKSTSTADATP